MNGRKEENSKEQKMIDVIIPIVFPDYRIMFESKKKKFEIPDLIPFVDVFPNEIVVPHSRYKVSDLGHAGVLFFEGKSGTTKYYEYGRYDKAKLGWVRKILDLPNLKIGEEGHPKKDGLLRVLSYISRKAGKSGRISASYIKVQNKYESILAFCRNRHRMNRRRDKAYYDLFSYSCLHFVKGAMEAADLKTPWLLDPRPVSYILEIQELFNQLEFSPRSRTLEIPDEIKLAG